MGPIQSAKQFLHDRAVVLIDGLDDPVCLGQISFFQMAARGWLNQAALPFHLGAAAKVPAGLSHSSGIVVGGVS